MTRNLLHMTWQILLLWLLFRLGSYLVDLLGVALPGNVAGMLILFTLLSTGVVKPAVVETGGGFLLKHFAFFFIPISVGLMAFGALMRQSGAALLAVLALSAMVGMAVTGVSVEFLHKRSSR